MKAISKTAVAGFVVGFVVALVLAGMASTKDLSPLIILGLWPTSIFGIGASGWQDGVLFHLFQSVLVFGGNGVLYGLFALLLKRIVFDVKQDFRMRHQRVDKGTK